MQTSARKLSAYKNTRRNCQTEFMDFSLSLSFVEHVVPLRFWRPQLLVSRLFWGTMPHNTEHNCAFSIPYHQDVSGCKWGVRSPQLMKGGQHDLQHLAYSGEFTLYFLDIVYKMYFILYCCHLYIFTYIFLIYISLLIWLYFTSVNLYLIIV